MNEFMMYQRNVRQILLVLYFLLSYNGVQGAKKISKWEDVELEKQLKLLNKPAIKTIKMKPTLSRIKPNSESSTTSRSSTIWSNNEGCPSGTVPIRRITKDDLIRHKHLPPPENAYFDDQFVISNNNSEQKRSYMSSNVYKRAIVRTRKEANMMYSGAGMAASLYNPHAEGKQHSGCGLKIHRGSDVLQVGWRVDPTLYGDNKTRLFIHSQAGKTQCFNTLCPGFVYVNTKIPLDMSYEEHLSQRGTVHIWEDTMFIDRDLVNGNWWLLMEENYEQIGFWPQWLFTDLMGFATHVDCGGVVYSPPVVPKPPMGSSFFPTDNIYNDAYCRSITVTNEKGEAVEVDYGITLIENYNMYNASLQRLYEGSESFNYVLYGGPGESTSV